MNYIEINRKAYDNLANQYEERTHEIDDNFWKKIYDELTITSSTNVLEIGPGSGRNLGILREYTSNLKAIELSENMSKLIKEKYPTIEIINKNIMDCILPNESQDVILMSAVIHNFPIEDAIKTLKLVGKWLTKDGYLIVSTTVHDTDEEGLLEKSDYRGNISRYRHRYTKESFKNLVETSGYDIYKSVIVKESERVKEWQVLICQNRG